MPTITETLAVEHSQLNSLFDEITHLLPDAQTVHELQLLSRLVEGVLARHGESEDNLAYSALNHALAEKGQLHRLFLDHQEIDAHLCSAGLATEFSEAMQLLKAGLNASRQHFRWEERTIFPLFDQHFSRPSLKALGAQRAGKTPSSQLRRGAA